MRTNWKGPGVKLKTAELTGAALDWAVAQIEGQGFYRTTDPDLDRPYNYAPSTDWSQGGPIIEREGILLRPIRCTGHSMDGTWLAMYDRTNTGTFVQWVEFLFKDTNRRRFWRGETALIAAMRCFVASKLGDEVDVPEELA